jgi:hypothetical protein
MSVPSTAITCRGGNAEQFFLTDVTVCIQRGKTFPDKSSGIAQEGMRRRLVGWRIISYRPDIHILDECIDHTEVSGGESVNDAYRRSLQDPFCEKR